jgi:hypothetical protein
MSHVSGHPADLGKTILMGALVGWTRSTNEAGGIGRSAPLCWRVQRVQCSASRTLGPALYGAPQGFPKEGMDPEAIRTAAGWA